LENLRPVIDDLIEEARADMEYDEDEYHHLIVENDALRERYKKSQNDKKESDKIINELTSENQEIKETLRRLHYKTSPEKGGKRKVFVVNELIHYEEGAQ
jgi:regulator of replication initiation timing